MCKVTCVHRGCTAKSETKEMIHRCLRGESLPKPLWQCVQSQHGQEDDISGWEGEERIGVLIGEEGAEVDPKEIGRSWIIKEKPCISCEKSCLLV